MSQDSGTISGVRSVGISIGTAATSGNYGFWTDIRFWRVTSAP
jgi:hypothetical protein